MKLFQDDHELLWVDLSGEFSVGHAQSKVVKIENDLFISPERKNTALEMALKSFILSRLDHQMSISWKRIAAHELETTSKFDLLKNWVPDCSAQGRISAKSF